MQRRIPDKRIVALLFSAWLPSCTSSTVESAPQPIVSSPAADWTMLGYDLASTYWNKAETQVTTDTVSKLEKAWDFDTGGSVTSTPVVSGGKVYVLSQGVFAIDLVKGKQIWNNPNLAGSSSLALSDGVLYVNDQSGIVHALRAKDGSEIWKYQTPGAAGADGFSSPIVTKDYVLYSLSTNEEILQPEGGPTFKGFVAALTKDGTPAWQQSTVTGNEHGVTVWSTVSVDETLGLVYAATGNNHGPPAGTTSDAFLAMPLAGGTGGFKWTRQIYEGDTWMPGIDSPDADFGANPIVFDFQAKKLVAGGNKGGSFWVLDRETGTILKKVSLGTGTAFKGGVFVSGAWDGKRLLAVCNNATSAEPGSEDAGDATAGFVAVLYAMDPLTLDVQWSRQVIGPVYGPITVANGVGFFGKNTTLQAFDTDTGKVLFEFKTEATIATAPVVSNGYVVFGSGMSWLQAKAGSKYYALRVPH